MKRLICALLVGVVALSQSNPAFAKRKKLDKRREAAIQKALKYLKTAQNRQGYWEAKNGQYRIAMTALAGMALLCEGSTTNTGKYKKQISRAVDYLTGIANPKNGLIGFKGDYRYTYGHGFSMLFLAQVFGDEENSRRRKVLKRVLTKAVEFSRDAQTAPGGWGYVSAKEQPNFDEGSTCITQVQGLRACRNAGIPVPKDVIIRAKKYIFDCTIKTGSQAGGVVYSAKYIGRTSGARSPITAAACAAMFNAGEFRSIKKKNSNKKATKVVKKTHLDLMLQYCKNNVWPGGNMRSSRSHWHYAHYYYSQVVYRLGDKEWEKYMKDVGDTIIRSQSADGSWKQGYIGPVYTTAVCATILQLDRGIMPIYQR